MLFLLIQLSQRSARCDVQHFLTVSNSMPNISNFTLGVTVLGGVFNKLSLEGFYNLEACKEAVTSYFNQYGHNYFPYGFIPLLPLSEEVEKVDEEADIMEESVNVTDVEDVVLLGKDETSIPNIAVSKSKRKAPSVDVLVDAFLQNVDFGRLLFDVFKYSVSISILITTDMIDIEYKCT